VRFSRSFSSFGILAILSALAYAAPVFGAAGRQGYTKLLVSHLFVQPNASAPAQISGNDGLILADYDSFSLVSAPQASVERIVARGVAAGLGVTIHDEYDLVGLPGGTIDTRIGIVKPPTGETISAYASGKYGLYVLQFIGPPRPEWIKTLLTSGAVIIEAVPLNAYVVALTPEIAVTLSKLSEVQFLEIYQPFLKGAIVDRVSGIDQDVIVEVAEAPGIAETTAAITRVLGSVEQRKNRGGLYLYGRLKPGDVSKLLSDPLVIAIHQLTGLTPSDERQATSLSSNTMTSGGNVIPTQPGSYASWLTGANACNVCGNLSNEGFIIGIADTGVDSGANAY